MTNATQDLFYPARRQISVNITLSEVAVGKLCCSKKRVKKAKKGSNRSDKARTKIMYDYDYDYYH